ncbi:hypothetical protein LOCC1_G003054 [Lachnellula occidentalis]|uniref:F-box domain-containing protein n=1 Tax=Lachnellula occidentalis TaxID=215460 RepID=A0A8H8S3Q0_9HELO|nr:hypothetical protein LOCC1_G003054 [Lachnellula occidentalis]
MSPSPKSISHQQLATLLSLPVDLHVLIIPFLDFTCLISLAQTSQFFRNLINPQRHHFVGRLLEIECLPYNGGEVILDLQKIFPTTVRYACTSCLKILPHTKFDNHALLRLRFRKPPPESRAGKQLCSWTSGDAKAQGLKRQADLKNDTFENWMLREHPLIFSPTPELRESYSIGTCRHRRTCNECKFQSGFWARNLDLARGWRVRSNNQNVGSANVPIIKSRQVYTYHDASQRFFPGLFPYTGEYPARRRVYREHLVDLEPWCLYSARCLGCERWQEFAAFRQPRLHKSRPQDAPAWDVQGWEFKIEELRCNTCVAAASGEQELGRQLVALWKTLADSEVNFIDYCLEDGWRSIHYLEQENKNFSWARTYRRARIESQLLREVPQPKDIGKMSVEARREIYGIWKQYLQEQGEEMGLGKLISNPWFKYWSYGYEAMEKRAEFLRACTDKVEADPGILVEYALRGEGYEAMRLSY